MTIPTFSNLKPGKIGLQSLAALVFSMLLSAVKTLHAQPVVVLKDINTKTASSLTERFTTVGGQVFFIAVDPVPGRCLNKTDGTTNGTVLVKGFNSFIYSLPALSNLVEGKTVALST